MWAPGPVSFVGVSPEVRTAPTLTPWNIRVAVRGANYLDVF